METYLKLLESSKTFDLFIRQIERKTTYDPIWKKYFPGWKYSPTLTFQAYLGFVNYAIVASVIDFSADKPIRTRPTAGQMTGTIPSMGDRFQMDKKTMREWLELEEYLKKTKGNLSELFDLLFNDFESAAIAPHKRLDYFTLLGMSTGVIKVEAADNPKGIIWEIDLGVTKTKTRGVPWAIGTTTSTPLTDIQFVLDENPSLKFANLKMSKATFNKMIASSEFTSVFTLNLTRLKISPVHAITKDMVNTYFESIGYPQIVIMDDVIGLQDNTSLKPFADDRVLFSVNDVLGNMYYTYQNELKYPESGKSYAQFDKNLISTYNTNSGRFLEYEMLAFPVFEDSTRMKLLTTDVQTS